MNGASGQKEAADNNLGPANGADLVAFGRIADDDEPFKGERSYYPG